MSKATINVGAAPDDGTGDTLRAAFVKVQANFDELYNLASGRIVVGAGAGGAPLTYTNLTYSEASGPRLTVGNSNGTSTGIISGYAGASGYGAIWSTAVTPTVSNYAILIGDGTSLKLTLATPSTASDAFAWSIHGVGTKAKLSGNAGEGFNIIAGTATTNVQALSVTQTWNAAGVTFTGKKNTFTLTGYHANSLLEDWRSASASLFAIHNTGAFGGVGTTFANAPSAPWTGMIQNFTDSNTATWGATIAGGGANNVLGRYNGANWTVVGA